MLPLGVLVTRCRALHRNPFHGDNIDFVPKLLLWLGRSLLCKIDTEIMHRQHLPPWYDESKPRLLFLPSFIWFHLFTFVRTHYVISSDLRAKLSTMLHTFKCAHLLQLLMLMFIKQMSFNLCHRDCKFQNTYI